MKTLQLRRLVICFFFCTIASAFSISIPHFDSLKWKECKELIEKQELEDFLIDTPDYPVYEKTKEEFLKKTQLSIYDTSSTLSGECIKYQLFLIHEKSTIVRTGMNEIIITSSFEVPYSLFHDCFLTDEIHVLAQQHLFFYHNYYQPIYMTCVENSTNSTTINNWKRCFDDHFAKLEPCPEVRRFEIVDQINEVINSKSIPICSRFYDVYWNENTQDQLLNYEGYFEECMKALEEQEFIKTSQCVKDQIFTPMFLDCSKKKAI